MTPAEQKYLEFEAFFHAYGLTPREEQVRVLEQVAEHWETHDCFIIDAPTGVGKQFIAQAIAEASINSYILTAGIELQNQYLSVGNLVDIRGRRHYPCTKNPGLTANSAPCSSDKSFQDDCLKHTNCVYFNKLAVAEAADNTSMNFDFFLFSRFCGNAKNADRKRKRREVLICDEAHLLEDALVNSAKLEMSIPFVKKLYKIKTSIAFKANDIEWNRKQLLLFRDALTNRFIILQAEYRHFVEKHNITALTLCSQPTKIIFDMQELANKIDSLDKTLKKLQMFFMDIQSDQWLDVYDHKASKVILTPKEIASFFSSRIRSTVQKVVFMSATIGNHSEFSQNYALPKSKTIVISADTPFSPENSLIKYVPTVRVSTSKLETQQHQLAEEIARIIDLHPYEKGIIHTSNYKLAELIVNHEKLKKHESRIITMSSVFGKEPLIKETNSSLVKLHKTCRVPSILISPSMTTGISLDDDFSRFQIIAKLPFENLTDPRISYFASKNNDWYLSRMFRELLQACGRSVRSESDWAISYIIDANFEFAFSKQKSMLPKWFLSRVILPTPPEKAPRVLLRASARYQPNTAL